MATTASEYHRITSYNRHEMKGHWLDWANRPAVYKEYRGEDYFPLPHPANLPRVPFHHLTDLSRQNAPDRQIHTIEQLSVILALAYGITGYTRTGGDTFYYRSAPSAGALYPVEIYLAVKNIDGLGAGLYHYDVSGHKLCLLRPGNVMPFADACIEKDRIESQPHISFFLSAIIFRSAWKYRERAFRYLLLDTGHVLENLSMALRTEKVLATVHYDVHGDRANQLLGLDPKREICFAYVQTACDKSSDTDAVKGLDNLPRNIIDAGRVAEIEKTYREIEEIILASSAFPSHDHHPSDMTHHLGLSHDGWQQIERTGLPFSYDFPEAVINRRSRRNFISDELPENAFFELLSFLSRAWKPGQPMFHPVGSVISTGLLVQNVKNVPSGFYLCDFSERRWAHVRPGHLCGAMAAVCLDQQWLRNAAVHFCFLANLDQLDQNRGTRGYRYAMLNAGRLGQRIYLAAGALGLGCCGIGAFYDDEARTLLGLDRSSALLYLVAAGTIKR